VRLFITEIPKSNNNNNKNLENIDHQDDKLDEQLISTISENI
jgi:hypothetical protein